MPLLPPGHAEPMPVEDHKTPTIEDSGLAPPPPIPGDKPAAPASTAPPPPVNEGFHEPPPMPPQDEPADVHVLHEAPAEPIAPVHVIDNEPPPIPSETPVAAAPVAPPPPPAAPPAQTTSARMPAGTSAAGDRVLGELADEGFEGLDIGFGSFPIVRLTDKNFSTNDGDSLGETFLCIMHATRTKWLYKAEDSNECDEFVYSYDQETTTSGNKTIDEVTAEWAAQGYDNPVWKKYLDITAQRVDYNTKQIGEVVILSVPKTSVARLTGYITTLKLGRRMSPSEMVTQVYAGQKVTAAKKPFYPWAFKAYADVATFCE